MPSLERLLRASVVEHFATQPCVVIHLSRADHAAVARMVRAYFAPVSDEDEDAHVRLAGMNALGNALEIKP